MRNHLFWLTASLLASILLAPSASFHAQTIVSGTVLDSASQRPVGYVGVELRSTNRGTYTNTSGSFRLHLASFPDTLVVSALGYATQRIPLDRSAEPLTVLLAPRELTLNEVVISPLDPRDLLRQAVARVAENYVQEPYRSRGFYRELIQENGRYIELNEAVMDSYRPSVGMQNARGGRMLMLKSRSKQDTSYMPSIEFRLGGGGPTDGAMRGIEPDFLGQSPLEEKHFDLYDYNLRGTLMYGGREVYLITFDQEKRKRRKLYEGEIFLDVRDLTILSLRFRSSSVGRRIRFNQIADIPLKYRAMLMALELGGIELKLLDHRGRYDFSIEENGAQPVFNQSSVRFYLKIPRSMIPDSLNAATYHVNWSWVITEPRTVDQSEISRVEAYKNEPLTELSGPYDDAFWEEYEVITPTESLRQVIESMRRKE